MSNTAPLKIFSFYPRRYWDKIFYVDTYIKIKKAGTVRDPTVLTSMPAGLFDEAALETVLRYRYKPRVVGGKPVVVEGVQKRISFSPSGQDGPEELKSDSRKKQPEQAVIKKVYDMITQAQEMIDAGHKNSALSVLENLKKYDNLSDYERSNVLNYLGFVHYNMDNPGAAIAAYEEMLLIPGLQENPRKQTLYTLAQLNMVLERYTEAIDPLEEWFTLEHDPAEQAYILYGQSLYQAGRYRDMINPVETAIRIAEIRKNPVKEDWYALLRSANSAIDELEAARDVSQEMNGRWPSADNSYALAMAYAKLGDRDKAHAELRELLASWPETDHLTPLHLAVAAGQIALVTRFLANGGDVNLQARKDKTLLHWAVEFDQVETTEALLAAKADVNARTSIDFTALHQAALQGSLVIVEMLIAVGAEVDAVSKYETSTPLLLAVTRNHAPVVEMLISAGAEVNARTPTNFTALHRAAQDGLTSIVEALIAAGADVNAVSSSETPPLFLAITRNHTRVVEMLISAGADVNAKNEADLVFLHSASKHSDAAIVEMLIAAGAEISARSETGRTPLHWAAESGNAPAVEVLLAAGAEVNLRDENDWTPLMWAAFSGNAPAVVDMFIAAGAEVDPKSKDGRTPLSWVAFWGDAAVATQLISLGADVAGVEMMADRGTARAQALLGSLYANGRGTKANKKKAARWFQAAAELNNADAAFALGEIYLDSRVIKENKKKAAKWFQAAAHHGHRDAQAMLGELYLNGVGVRKDPTEASIWSCLAGVQAE